MNMTKAYYCLYKMNIRSIVQKEKKKNRIEEAQLAFSRKERGKSKMPCLLLLEIIEACS